MSARRVLFFAEAVSLAHVARPVRLAESLDNSWDIHFALANEYRNFLSKRDWTIHTVDSVQPIQFLRRLQRGAPLFSTEELERSVTADLRLIESTKPDVVVGDFRLSLAVSARLAKVPYVAICNAHWSPWSKLTDFPSPDISILNAFGPRLANLLFRIGRPAAFWLHTLPINRIRRQFGLQPYRDIRFAYTDGDLSLYADTPYLVPTKALPDSHRYLGPILWAPQGSLPGWWNKLTASDRLAYVTLGSTGRADLLPMALRACENHGLTTIVATAGRADVTGHETRHVADFLPGDQAAERAAVVVCNGGSATVYQALSKGTPVVGICSNLDQFLTMHYVSRAGAGVGLRASSADQNAIKAAIVRATSESSVNAAKPVQDDFARFPIENRFPLELQRCIDRVRPVA